MSENPFFVYLNYVRDVLGAHQVLTETVDLNLRDHFFHPDEKLELGQKWDLIFVNTMFSSIESIFDGGSHELFQKMLTAMKLGDQKILYVDTDLMNEKEIIRRWKSFGLPQAMVIFKDNPTITDGLRWVDDTSVIETYSPYHLQHFPEFKKITWNHLQVVMEHLRVKPLKN
jgi:hypothetical protein